MKFNLNKTCGFTLVELLIVVSVIGVLAGLVLGVMNTSGIKAKTRDAQRTGNLRKIQVALEQYYSEYRRYPISAGGNWDTTGAALATLITEGYIKSVPVDPVSGSSYPYRSNIGGSIYILISQMEITTSVPESACTDLDSWSYFSDNTPIATNLCYGVESPTALIDPNIVPAGATVVPNVATGDNCDTLCGGTCVSVGLNVSANDWQYYQKVGGNCEPAPANCSTPMPNNGYCHVTGVGTIQAEQTNCLCN